MKRKHGICCTKTYSQVFFNFFFLIQNCFLFIIKVNDKRSTAVARRLDFITESCCNFQLKPAFRFVASFSLNTQTDNIYYFIAKHQTCYDNSLIRLESDGIKMESASKHKRKTYKV